jgi:hypothetical protein
VSVEDGLRNSGHGIRLSSAGNQIAARAQSDLIGSNAEVVPGLSRRNEAKNLMNSIKKSLEISLADLRVGRVRSEHNLVATL